MPLTPNELMSDRAAKEEILRLIDPACRRAVGLNDDPTDIWGRLCEIRREIEGSEPFDGS